MFQNNFVGQLIAREWILKAKKPETHRQRMVQTVELAAKNIKANHC
jgi:hypothetical protein